MVEWVRRIGSCGLEERFQVGFEGGLGGEVAGVAGDAVCGGRIGGLEFLDGGADAGGIGGGDGDGGAEFEASFGDAVADS
jgi:hypothetical protein